MHKGQVYDGVFGAGEEEGTARQVQAKYVDKRLPCSCSYSLALCRLRGMLVAQRLLPDAQSGLWDTEDVAKWDEWAAHETDLPAKPHKSWDSLDVDQLADVVAGVVTDGWAPGAARRAHAHHSKDAQDDAPAAH
jgi:hypothetical protein